MSRVNAVILGSGTSHGVPMIACQCAVCTSDDPKDKRTRSSLFVRVGGQRILVDTSPELRLQCVANGIDAIDAILYTHHHADHVLGIDDLRRFNWTTHREVPCFGRPRTLDALRSMFRYAFEPVPGSPHSRPCLDLIELDGTPFRLGDVSVTPISLLHGRLEVLGFRFSNLAYCTDCNYISEASLALLEDLDVLILDALRHTPHPAHFNLEQAIAMARRIGARRTYFTHIAHELGHEATNRDLPDSMALAHDGLRIECT
ncbi:MAG: MBL fold metallo-hydrolase [Phycisphaerae bacterium]